MHNRQSTQLSGASVPDSDTSLPLHASNSINLLPCYTDDDTDKKQTKSTRSRVVVPSSAPSMRRLAKLLAILGLAAAVIDIILLHYTYRIPSISTLDNNSLLGSSAQERVDGLAPDWMLKYDRGVPAEEREHLSLLRLACSTDSNSIIPSRVGRSFDLSADPIDAREDDQMTLDARRLLHKGDPHVLQELRRCPEVDIFLPSGLRGLGYCEDASAYTKFLESRMLPHWAIKDKFVDPDDPENRTVTYHDLCPHTPLLFFNHYWDGVPDDPVWPKNKPIYLMPNIEMHELKAQHYWRSDVVLCKTRGCQERVTRWYNQQGNPRGSRVYYTRHTSTDVARYAKSKFNTAGAGNLTQQEPQLAPKDFAQRIRFTHAVGSSMQKGTSQVLKCWLSRPDLPPLDVYIHEGTYNSLYRKKYDSQVARANNVKLHLGRLNDVAFGRVVAESAFFLCPSVSEGYGHYINQARASGGVIVTTNAHPMNELISSGEMGVFVKTERRADHNALLGGAYTGEHGLSSGGDGFRAVFSPGDLCDAVDFVIRNTTVQQREQMGARAQRAFHDDTKFFARRMLELRLFARGQQINDGKPVQVSEAAPQLRVSGEQ